MSMISQNDKRVEVLAVQRRRRWTAAEKLAMVRETYEAGLSVSMVARQHGVNPNLIFQWRRLERAGALTAVSAERLLGKKTLEADPERSSRGGARTKVDCAHPCYPRTIDEAGMRCPGCSAQPCSCAGASATGSDQRRGRHPRTDHELKAELHAVIMPHATYGYRRAAALVSRRRCQQRCARVNHKRVYRVMRAAGWLLARHIRRPLDGRAHDGTIAVAASNRREDPALSLPSSSNLAP